MAQWHLDEIKNSLNKIGWKIIEYSEPTEKNCFIGVWVIKRDSKRIMVFDGIFDVLVSVTK